MPKIHATHPPAGSPTYASPKFHREHCRLVAIAQAARDLDVHEAQMRSWRWLGLGATMELSEVTRSTEALIVAAELDDPDCLLRETVWR